jgi:carbamoyl-phosphate synthase small subunit
VVAVDLGLKRATPRYLAQQGCEVHVLPATATPDDVLALEPDGVFFSNGPGDPATTDGPVAVARACSTQRVPLFGICFGNQILGRALGLGTYKLRYGHRGVNQPVHGARHRAGARHQPQPRLRGRRADRRLAGRHPYGPVRVSHVDLNDDVVEGLELLEGRAFSVQYHPEAAPGRTTPPGCSPRSSP